MKEINKQIEDTNIRGGGQREYLAEIDENILVLDPSYFDEAILGTVWRCGQTETALYDANKCVELIALNEDMSYEDAQEWFDYNTSGGYYGEYTPHFVWLYEKE